jgi:hypothetical protein
MKSKQIRLPFLNGAKRQAIQPSRSLSLPLTALPKNFSLVLA